MGKSSWDYPQEVQTKLKGKKVWMAEYDADEETHTPVRGKIIRVVRRSIMEPLFVGIAMDDNPEVETLENIYYVFPDKKTVERYIEVKHAQFKLEEETDKLNKEEDELSSKLNEIIKKEWKDD